jgi:hypothetical protein
MVMTLIILGNEVLSRKVFYEMEGFDADAIASQDLAFVWA